MRDQRPVTCIRNTGAQLYGMESLFYLWKGRKLKQLFTIASAALSMDQGFTVTITTANDSSSISTLPGSKSL